MSINTTVNAVLEASRVYPELPPGVQIWTANGSVTGDGSGGQQSVTVRMHPSANRAFTLYVALAKTSVKTQVAANTGRIEVRISVNTDWEFDYSEVVPLDTLNPNVTTAATVQKADEHQHLQYLGRTSPGTNGSFQFTTIEINTMVMGVRAAGFYSDRPFIPHNDWRL